MTVYWAWVMIWAVVLLTQINTLRTRPNGRHFPDDIFKWISLNENVWISIRISLKLVCFKGPIYIPPLIQIMAWRRPDDKSISKPMDVSLPKHICVTRPQWAKYTYPQCFPLNKKSVSVTFVGQAMVNCSQCIIVRYNVKLPAHALFGAVLIVISPLQF